MTNLIRFAPSADAARMQREFDRLFGSFFPAARETEEAAETTVWAPRLDLLENDEAYMIEVDLPGVPKGEVNVSYHDGVLSISGDRAMKEVSEKDNCVRVERAYGRFYRSFNLPKKIDEGHIEATYADGVLSVHVPKSEDSKPRRISIS